MELDWEEHNSRERNERGVPGEESQVWKHGALQTWEFSGKMGLCTKHVRGRRSGMKEKEFAMGTGESGDAATSNTLQH